MANIPVIFPALNDATSSLYGRVLDSYNSINDALGPSRCGLDYGVDIRPVDCVVAKRQLFSNEALSNRYSVATYYLNRGQDTTFDLPQSRTYGK